LFGGKEKSARPVISSPAAGENDKRSSRLSGHACYVESYRWRNWS